jgi:superfamily II DNA/RNA helicase
MFLLLLFVVVIGFTVPTAVQRAAIPRLLNGA